MINEIDNKPDLNDKAQKLEENLSKKLQIIISKKK
jgi:hypothetical protein